MNTIKALLAGLLFTATVSVGGSPQCHAQAAAAKEGLVAQAERAQAPDFEVIDVNGKQVALSKYKGRVVLLDFWAVNCGGCKLEIPWYVEFDSKYRKSGLSLIGLDMYGESPELIKTFMQKSKTTYPVAVGTDALGERYGLKEMPLTLLIDRKGRIALSHAGVIDRGAFERELQRLLAE